MRCRSIEQPVSQLSGGNQQKVAFGRWVFRGCRVLLCDEPSRGIDLAARAAIHRQLRALAEQGVAVVVASSDLPEIIALSDRVVVLSRGVVSRVLDRAEVDRGRHRRGRVRGTREGVVTVRDAGGHSSTPVEPVRRWRTGEYVGLVIALVLVALAFGAATRHFLTPTTFRTIANQVPAALMLATGVTLVLVSGGIDLSVGSVLGLCGVVLGVALGAGWPPALAALAAVGVGGLAGFANGWLTVRWALPSFIVTLGMLEAARGATYLLSGSRTLYVGSGLDTIAAWTIAGVQAPFFVSVAVVIVAQVVLTRTVFGRYLVAIGTNEEAVRLAGVDSAPVKVRVFVLSGLAAGLAAVFNTARLGAADPNAGTGAELQAIAAAVIGGTSLLGGRGSTVATALGVLILAVLGAGLAQVGAQEPTKRLVTGAVIVVAALLDYYRRRARTA